MERPEDQEAVKVGEGEEGEEEEEEVEEEVVVAAEPSARTARPDADVHEVIFETNEPLLDEEEEDKDDDDDDEAPLTVSRSLSSYWEEREGRVDDVVPRVPV